MDTQNRRMKAPDSFIQKSLFMATHISQKVTQTSHTYLSFPRVSLHFSPAAVDQYC